MAQIEIFFHSRHDALEAALNRWFGQNDRQLNVLGLTLDSNKYGHSLAILYEPGPGPACRARVWHSASHSALGAQVQSAPLGDCRWIAIGSNEYGHTLAAVETLP